MQKQKSTSSDVLFVVYGVARRPRHLERRPGNDELLALPHHLMQ